MERTKINNLIHHIGKKVLLKGWIHEARDQSKIKFIILRDNSGLVQLVVTKEKKFFEEIAKLNKETSISVEGLVKEAKITNPEITEKTVEVSVDNYSILSESQPEMPIQIVQGKDAAELPVRLDWRCLDLRKPRNQAIFKVQAALLEGMKEFLDSNGFQQVFTPCIMGAPSESGAEMFQLKYFDRIATLRQDPQLHRQLTIAGGIEKLYDIGPSWRAEMSHTVKHLCEHRTCAVELAFIKDETDVMRVEEQLVVSALKKVNEKCSEELKLLGIELKVPATPFPVLNFPEIYDILEQHGKEIRGEDPDAEAEKILWEYVQKKYKTEFYFFNRFPSKVKPFYVMRIDDDPEYARSIDLNWKGMELSSGGQREHRYPILMEQVREKGVSPQSVEWFTKFFKYGVPPHGGFAIGIERITMMLLNLPNIREAVLFPRDPDRVEP